MTIMVRVPATIANMGPGFDSFGMAVSVYNRFAFNLAETDALTFAANGQADIQGLQQETQKTVRENILWKTLEKLYERAGQPRPTVHITVEADIPVARGLGSSSTAIIAALLAGNALLNQRFSKTELLELAIELEHHPDNVAPALLGGVVLYDTKPYSLPWPTDWGIIALSPDYPVKTESARRILPEAVSQTDSVFNLRKASVLTYALLREDADALRAALDDRLHQPYRRKLIAEYDALEQLVLEHGAFGIIISGSGPTMAVFYPNVLHASLLETLNAAIHQHHWPIRLHDVTLDRDGAQIVQVEPARLKA
jgi:homoserine kinase